MKKLLTFSPKSMIMLMVFIFSMVKSDAQTAWNNYSLRFTKDTASLVDMTGATPVAVDNPTGIWSSTAISLGFEFQYGLKKYTSFFASPYAFIKFGNSIAANNPENDTSVITPMYNTSFWLASYKMIGAAPNRKMVIEFTGTIQPISQTTKFQIWLNETSNKIQFVYDGFGTIGTSGSNTSYRFRVFLNNNIFNRNTVAALQVIPANALPTISYNTIARNYDSISPKTCYSFQPDTIKPHNTLLSFSNVQAGCLQVDMVDNSRNESLIVLEKSRDGINFTTGQYYYISYPLDSASAFFLSQTGLQPNEDYTYRVFSSTGFKNSDTLTATVRTTMPQINGIKRIPGDYNSITALLQDATCRHLGPDLVIELQSNYNISTETLPVTFNKNLQNRFINSITIRPATGVDLQLSAATGLFIVDSVKHILLDGRAGGNGSNRNLTLKQPTNGSAIVTFKNGADSCGITYCNLLNGVLYLNSNNGKKLDAITVTNNSFGSDQGMQNYLLRATATDSTGSSNFTIAYNEFSRFNRDAITFTTGGQNTIIKGNRFYQPDAFTAQTFLPDPTASCVKLMNTEFVTIDSNIMGGNTSEWGKGIFNVSVSPSGSYHFIHYQNASMEKEALIKRNLFGNISATGVGSSKMIYAGGGSITVDGNRIGTADSLVSITNSNMFWAMDLWYGKKYVINNFLSGIHGQYPSGTDNVDNYFITTSYADSIYIHGNDIGGSNNILANTASGNIAGIKVGLNTSELISGNEIRGFSSRKYNTSGMDLNIGFTSTPERALVDSNIIHHISSAASTSAISGAVNSTRLNRISYNTVYALSSTGQLIESGFPRGYISGVGLYIYDYTSSNQVSKDGQLHIFGNKIYGLEPTLLTNPTTSLFSITGIGGSAYNCKIWNNDVRLGIDRYGLPIDTNQTTITGITADGTGYYYVEHNSVFIGGRGYHATGIYVSAAGDSIRSKTIFVDNNIVQIDRKNIDPINPHEFFKVNNNIATASKNNLWYAANDSATTAGLLATFRQNCNCDTNSFVGNPRFANATGDSSHVDLSLNIGSKADSTGTQPVLDIRNDINGLIRARYTPVDIGSHAATISANYPNLWTGTVSTEWENPDNWSRNRVPDINTDVTINPGVPNYPQIQSEAYCRSLTVLTGASISVMPGYSIFIAN